MALIRCAKCGRQISSFAKACPACGTPPQVSTDPPPLPTVTARATDTGAFVAKLVVVIALVIAVVVAVNIFNKPESSTTSAPPWASDPLVSATPQQFPRAFPRAIPVAPATPATITYRVVKISQGDYLNVRTGAGSKYPIVMRLEPGSGGIVLGANRVANAETMWQEIIVNGRIGWVNADYIAPETQSVASP